MIRENQDIFDDDKFKINPTFENNFLCWLLTADPCYLKNTDYWRFIGYFQYEKCIFEADVNVQKPDCLPWLIHLVSDCKLSILCKHLI